MGPDVQTWVQHTIRWRLLRLGGLGVLLLLTAHAMLSGGVSEPGPSAQVFFRFGTKLLALGTGLLLTAGIGWGLYCQRQFSLRNLFAATALIAALSGLWSHWMMRVPVQLEQVARADKTSSFDGIKLLEAFEKTHQLRTQFHPGLAAIAGLPLLVLIGLRPSVLNRKLDEERHHVRFSPRKTADLTEWLERL